MRDGLARALLVLIFASSAAQAQSTALLNLVFVIDGLRPDSVTAAETPNLHRLRTEGVTFENSHSVFPTVTRVNSASLSTGMQPARHGILGNRVYIPAVNPDDAFNNSNHRMLLKLDEAQPGRIVFAPSIAELMAEVRQKYIAVSSGGPGSALLLAPRAPRGSGTVINGDFDSGRMVAWPQAVSDAVLQRFGPQPKKGGAKENNDSAVDWALRVLREYVLPELKPQVVYVWLTEPDHIQHAVGVGAPDSLASIRNSDRNIGLVLDALRELGLREDINIMVVSDHGFAQSVHGVNVRQELTSGGFKTEEVIVASSGQSVALHVKNRDTATIRAVAEWLQKQAWTGVVFTGRGKGAAHEGAVAGTFALEYVHLGGSERSPDIVFTFPWSSKPNRYGVPGTDYVMITSGATAPLDRPGGNHGGMSPWTVRNTMLAWGPDFKRGARVRTPSSNADVTPTILHLLGHPKADVLDGRVLLEALANGPDPEQVGMETRTLRVANGAYRAALQVTETAGRRYVDKSWRE
jgi:arylsulfatase A-like enzyme